MVDLNDFLHGPGWRFTNGCPQETYPDTHALILTGDSRSNLVSLAWIDSQMNLRQLVGIPFDPVNCCICGTDSEEKFDVEIKMTESGKLDGTVKERIGIAPETGTWGADANGGLRQD